MFLNIKKNNDLKAPTQILEHFKDLWILMPKIRRKHLMGLLFLMLITSIAEVISIGAVIPFLNVLLNSSDIYSRSELQFVIDFLNIRSGAQLMLFFGLTFIFFAVLAGLMRLSLLVVLTRITYSISSDFSIDIYKRILYQPYMFHASKNSSELISSITTKSNAICNNALQPGLVILSSALILVSTISFLFFLSPVVSIFSFLGFSFLYFAIGFCTKPKIERAGVLINSNSTQVLRVLQGGLGAIRDIVLDGSQKFYINQYAEAEKPLRNAMASVQILGGAPRFLMEALGIVLIVIIALILLGKDGENLVEFLPTLAALALSSQKLLPLLQQSYSSWISIKSGSDCVAGAIELLKADAHETESITNDFLPFQSSIIFKDISFKYPGRSSWVMQFVNLEIIKGTRVGVIGPSGGGKSTFVDILMGLITPTSGVITIDNSELTVANVKSWQRTIAHVPQEIFLIDGTIAENIAFGLSKDQIDIDRVIYAAKKAQLSDEIDRLPEKYQSVVGERGVLISGGQRQRIGIARALYKNASIIILDECTSALDAKNEDAVMKAIFEFNPSITLIVVAHRLTTLAQCEKLIKVEGGRVLMLDNKS